MVLSGHVVEGFAGADSHNRIEGGDQRKGREGADLPSLRRVRSQTSTVSSRLLPDASNSRCAHTPTGHLDTMSTS